MAGIGCCPLPSARFILGGRNVKLTPAIPATARSISRIGLRLILERHDYLSRRLWPHDRHAGSAAMREKPYRRNLHDSATILVFCWRRARITPCATARRIMVGHIPYGSQTCSS